MSLKKTSLLNVAIVEDSPNSATLIERHLRRLPAVGAIYLYDSAEAALIGIPPSRPDLVLMDIDLPGISSTECTRRLKSLLPRLRIIMVTVHDESDILDEALKNGADGYLTKPVRRPGAWT